MRPHRGDDLKVAAAPTNERASSGYRAAMPLLPVHPPEWIDTAPVIASSNVAIETDPMTVWGFIADHESWPTWFTDLKKVERIGTGIGIGGGRRVHIGKISVEEIFTAWSPGEHFAFAVTKSPVPVLAAMIESVEISPTESGCEVTYRQGLAPRRGTGRLVERVGTQLQGQSGAALVNLKRLAEAT